MIGSFWLWFIGCTGDSLFIEKEQREGDEPGECSDFVDNDRDLLFDCNDPDCAGAPTCQEVTPPPDEPVTPDTTEPEQDVNSEPVDTGPETTPEDAVQATEDAVDAPTPLEPLPRANPTSPCTPMEPVEGNVVDVYPDQLGSLENALVGMKPGDTILLHDGTYSLPPNGILMNVERVTLRTASGEPLQRHGAGSRCAPVGGAQPAGAAANR